MVGNCGDCIHFEVCSVWNKKFIDLRIKKQSVCEHFKNKADFAEVVRCKDCGVKGAAFCMTGDIPLTETTGE